MPITNRTVVYIEGSKVEVRTLINELCYIYNAREGKPYKKEQILRNVIFDWLADRGYYYNPEKKYIEKLK